jgi:hypothetical protein
VSLTFDGFGFDDNAVENAGTYFIPPDPIGAAGTDRLVAVVNAMIEARTKAGGLLWRDSLKDFFTTLAPANALFDPKVIFDPYESRFLVVALEKVEPGIANPSPGNLSRVLLAVSKTATPATATAADWNYVAFSGKFTIGGFEYWSDYPGFEVDEEAVYITNNIFEFKPLGGAFGGVRLWIVNKGVVGGFYGGGATAFTVHDPYAGGGIAATTMPCQVYGAGGVGPGIGTFLVSYSSLTAGGVAAPEFAQVVRVNAPLGAVSFVQEFVNIGDIENVGGGFGFPPLLDAPQLGTATPIEVNDSRALDCVWRSNRIWFTTTINPNAGPDVGQTTAHWIRLDTSAIPAPITLSDQGNIGGEDIAAGSYTYFPALAVNAAGDAQFGFAASAATIYAGAYVTGREAGDAAGTVQAAQTVKAGVDYYVRTFPPATRNRWGDYSGMSLDPTDDSVFWVFNEYANTRGTIFSGEDGRWGTTWGRSGFTGATTTTTTTATTTTTTTTIATSTTSTTTVSTTTTTTTTIPTTTTTTIPTTTTTTTTLTTTTTSSTTTTSTTLPPAVSCGASPVGGCLSSGKATFQVREKTVGKEKLKVAFKKLTTATTQGDFGDPVGGTTSYAICVYDQGGTLQAEIQVNRAGQTCGTKACWIAISTKGYKYSDKTASADGIAKISGKGGDPTKGQIQTKGQNNAAKGQTALPTGVAAALQNNTQATVQIVTSDASCFGETFTNVTRADGLEFKAVLP